MHYRPARLALEDALPKTDTKHEVHRPGELALFHKNPRQGDVDVIAASLRVNNQYRPIVVNRGTHTGRENEVLAGNHTLKAFRYLAEKYPDDERWQQIDCWMVDYDDELADRVVLIDNRAADKGTYDDEVLVELLNGLPSIEGTGYSLNDLAALNDVVNPGGGGGNTDPDDAPEPPKGEPTSKPGDIWELGTHRVLCGSATDTEAVLAMMGDDRASCVWTDPPYGVNYVGKTKDALEIQNDSSGDLQELLTGAFATAIAASRGGAAVYIAHADTERLRFEQCMRDSGMIFRQNLVWVKNTMVMGRSDYHYKHEPILYGFTPGGEGRLGRGGERWHGDNAQTTVFTHDKPARNGEHPTMKPVALIVDMLANSCEKGGVVLDMFGGSGSTMMAAQQYGASARLVELDPRYVDVICRRWQEYSGEKPINVATGQAQDFTRYEPSAPTEPETSGV